jgi:hypothetical protein
MGLVERTIGVLGSGERGIGLAFEFFFEFLSEKEYLAIEYFIYLIDIASYFFEFFFDLSLYDLYLFAVDVGIIDFSSNYLQILRQVYHFSTTEFNLSYLMLGSIVKEFLPPIGLRH